MREEKFAGEQSLAEYSGELVPVTHPLDAKRVLGVPRWSRDRMDGVRFERESSGHGFGVSMPGGYWVDEAFIRWVFAMFWRGVKKINPAKKYTAQILCNDRDWASRRRGDRIRVGRCFKFLASHEVLPIVLVNPDKSGPRKYSVNVTHVPTHG